ncbi:hypothetical protein CEUSTIGMA_g6384.t1 [Chlamydomonas eustigma]|uniref:PGR5-like protein 1A, chloroplastic n=1 Tax=Chlamydomonas eustigma TaxID=1157962 RepID=A0A250X783_9CHLO|nr:hypothetical protein CEUSTIGMA_g6384.t1 [Chlamydomonas eustigma]|eukprot:GAX78944.1 hypothetical protein CEUSTIGMA_g6384.t1 [Chlamydomonas eustigma]
MRTMSVNAITPAKSCVRLPSANRLKNICVQRLSSRLLPVKADNGKVQVASSIDESTENISGDYCQLDETGRKSAMRTIGEKEQEFLAAMGSYYYEKKSILSDAEFENLREELLWSGSKVAILDSDEQRFLEATLAYTRGQPILSDADYDELKAKLRAGNSIVTAQGPRCSIRSKKMYGDLKTDYARMLALNIPAVLLVLGIVFAIDDVTGFEITEAIELPPPYGVGLLWGLLLPTIFVIASALTNIGFKDSLILKGPCPNCGNENFTYFGDILTVTGNRGTNVVDCKSCRAGLTFDQNKRIVMVDEEPEEKLRKEAAAAAKKAAAAAKKKAVSPGA